MINLLYHSHTVVPAHLEELGGLGVLERDEQVLVALDGVLQDGKGQRLSGPTLHDYCLLTNLRVLLWARDYGRHLCYAFPLTELCLVEGVGIDPLHAQLQLTFAAPDTGEQRFTLALLPLSDLNPAVSLLHLAGEAAQTLMAQGIGPHEAGEEVATLLVEEIYGSVEGRLPPDTPYRWPGATTQPFPAVDSAFLQDPSTLPPERIYAAGRLARSAWDTLRRTLREAELPFDLNSGSLRDLADTVRAINELVNTVAGNPAAREMAMAVLNRRHNGGKPDIERSQDHSAAAPTGEDQAPPVAQPAQQRDYREIPLRRRGAPARDAAPPPTIPASDTTSAPAVSTDRPDIPLRRRVASAHQTNGVSRQSIAMSGSGDAEKKGE